MPSAVWLFASLGLIVGSISLLETIASGSTRVRAVATFVCLNALSLILSASGLAAFCFAFSLMLVLLLACHRRAAAPCHRARGARARRVHRQIRIRRARCTPARVQGHWRAGHGPGAAGRRAGVSGLNSGTCCFPPVPVSPCHGALIRPVFAISLPPIVPCPPARLWPCPPSHLVSLLPCLCVRVPAPHHTSVLAPCSSSPLHHPPPLDFTRAISRKPQALSP